MQADTTSSRDLPTAPSITPSPSANLDVNIVKTIPTLHPAEKTVCDRKKPQDNEPSRSGPHTEADAHTLTKHRKPLKEEEPAKQTEIENVIKDEKEKKPLYRRIARKTTKMVLKTFESILEGVTAGD